jgi:4-amino-4-deoxy-L-arabinose transferase-like glycosyltransferase
MTCALVLIFLITLALTGSDVVALLTALIAIPLITKGIDRFNTEIPATCLILASCYAMLLLLEKPTLLRGFVAGLCLGAAILTKAIILYVFPFVAIGSVILTCLQLDSVRGALAIVAVMVAGTALIVTPWIARNATLLDEAQVANRGGPVLYKRMLLDNMTWEEYRGSFYVFAPNNVRSLLERTYGFTRDDIAAGGSLQRLNRSLKLPTDVLAVKEAVPDLATTYQYKMLAKRARLAREFGNQLLGDREMMHEAFSWILTHPLQHLSLVAPLAWRGMWVRTIPTWLVPIALASLIVAPFVGWAMRRWDFVAFSLLPVGIFFAYAGVSHFIPRYSEPLVGAMLICLVTMTCWLVSSLPITTVVESLLNSAQSLRSASHSSSSRREEESR